MRHIDARPWTRVNENGLGLPTNPAPKPQDNKQV